jgi:hypothetical protein
MDSIELDKLRRRARMKYEWARLSRAVWGFAPVLLIVAIAAWAANRSSTTLLFGAATFSVGVVFLWYGRDLKRAVLPGLGAGFVPLVLALCANHMGHYCTGDACVSLCLPACTAGGVVAGLTVAYFGYRGKHGLGYWGAGSTVALLTGAMGCACIGFSGLFGLGAGYLVGLLPMMARKLSA